MFQLLKNVNEIIYPAQSTKKEHDIQIGEINTNLRNQIKSVSS